jgi:DNA invertase Pin-like site-specific DNA recombinase
VSSPTKAAIYARVSTQGQDYALQLHDLRAYAKRMDFETVEYVEKESSVKKRPVFQSMLEDARRGRVNVILVWRIDRFARSMKDYVNITLDLYQQKVRLISITENVDTGDQNPFAEFQRGLLALLAQLERKIIVARVSAGIAEAKRQGKHCGRPKRIFSRDEALRLQQSGLGLRAIAAKMGVHFSTVSRALAFVAKVSPK